MREGGREGGRKRQRDQKEEGREERGGKHREESETKLKQIKRKSL